MKVTISFNGTKIVVPCGDGDITVRELTALAATRYKKAIGKHQAEDYWVSVSSLKSEEGGMLDPDDLLCDVADDREQLAAIFDEQKGVGHLGDGMSSDSDNGNERLQQGRRGSEQQQYPQQHLDAPFGHPQMHHHMPSPHGSASQLYRPQQHQHLYGQTYSTASSSSTLVPMEVEQQMQQMPPPSSIPSEQESNFDSLPDSQSFETKCSLHVLRRREPLGASANKPDKKGGEGGVEFSAAKQQQIVRPSVEVVIPNEIGPLGIHVVPCNEDGRLVVQGIEPKGRVDRDGRLTVGDEIIEINDYPLTTVTFNKAQEIFKEALFAKELRLQVIKGVADMVADNKENVSGASESAPVAPGPSTPPAGSKITSAFQANNTRKIGDVFRIFLKKGPSGLGFSITTRDNAPGGITPIYIKTIMPKGAAIEEGRLKPGDRLLEVNGTSLDGMGQSEVVSMLRNVETNAVLELVVSRHAVGGSSSQTDGGITPGGSQRSSTKRKPSPDTQEPDASRDASLEAAKSAAGAGAVYRPNPTIDDPEPRSLSPATSHYESYDSDGGHTSGGSSFQFPWKQREILTFDIPVHDTERAGLGVSVKGKTSSNSDGSVADLGIFVKSVLHGGAASRDGRLSNNDQLVNINGLSLLGKPNPQAMETLRKAMHEEGPMPGIISLTVARKIKGELAPGEKDERRNSMSSVVTSSSDDIVREYNVSQPMFKSPQKPGGADGGSQQQQQMPPPLPAPNAAQQQALNQLRNTRNPVIDRLMGKDSAGIVPSNIRNDSYYIATHHDTFNASMMQQQLAAQQRHQQQQEPLDCPTVYQTGPESLMIEQEDRPQTTDSADTRESLTSLVDLSGNLPHFSRDMPGRQSMSEKRHATLDAKSTDTYQKRKKARDDRMRKEKEQQHIWKKSASVESLHTAGATEILSEEEREALKNSYVRANSVRVSRSRGCNESFRQAVDRSYERDLPEGEDYEIEELGDDYQLGKVSADKSEKKKNRNSKLLRNFGAMFRLGSGGAGSGGSKSQNRKSIHGGPASSDRSQSTSSMLPISQSVPDYKSYSKSRSGGDLAGSNTVSDFTRPYAPQQQQQQPRHPSQPPLQGGGGDTYDYLPSAMMRPGSRVGIADPSANTAHSDYEVIQRHLHRNRALQQPQPAPQLAPSQYRNHPQHHARSQSNPSRVQQRPKSNFYEYDLWSEQRFAQPPQPMSRPGGVPQQQQNLGADSYYFGGAGGGGGPPNPHAIRRYSPQPGPSFHQQQQHQHGLPQASQQQQQSHHFHCGEVAPVGTHFSLPRGSK